MEEIPPKKRKCKISKEQHPIGLHGFQSKKRSLEKEDDKYTPPMPPGNKKNKNNGKACASTVANTDVISMCVIPVKVKYKIQILFIAPLPC